MQQHRTEGLKTRRRGRIGLLAVAGSAVVLAACVPLKGAPPAPPSSTDPPPSTTPPPAGAATLECTGPDAYSDILSIGSTQTVGTCVLENTGTAASGALAATLADQDGTGEWTIVLPGNDDCEGVSLQVGESCGIVVTFQSTGSVGNGEITLHVAAANGATLDHQLAGTVEPDVDITAPASVTTAEGNNVQFNVDIENLGSEQTGALAIDFVVGDPTVGTLSMPGGNCVDLAPSGTCFITYNWEGLQAGNTSVTVTITPDTGIPTTVVVNLETT